MKNGRDSVVLVALSQIRDTKQTQSRVMLTLSHVEDIVQAMENNEPVDPVHLVLDQDGMYWVADGHHRIKAAKKVGMQSIRAIVSKGDSREALRLSLGSNHSHGLKRTNEDKRFAVRVALRDKEWSQMSDRAIADWVHVGHPMVSAIRREEGADHAVRKGLDGKTRKTKPAKESPQKETQPKKATPTKQERPSQLEEIPVREVPDTTPTRGAEDLEDRVEEVRHRMQDWLKTANSILRDMRSCAEADRHWARVEEYAAGKLKSFTRELKIWAPVGTCPFCKEQQGCPDCIHTGLMVREMKKVMDAGQKSKQQAEASKGPQEIEF